MCCLMSCKDCSSHNNKCTKLFLYFFSLTNKWEISFCVAKCRLYCWYYKILSILCSERPEQPSSLKVLDKSGRSVELSWTRPYDGNSPVTRYIVEYKLSRRMYFLFLGKFFIYTMSTLLIKRTVLGIQAILNCKILSFVQSN